MNRRLLVSGFACILTSVLSISAREGPKLGEEQIRDFLLQAKVIHSGPAGKGFTGTTVLTLSDGTVTHDASFQSIDEEWLRPGNRSISGHTKLILRCS